MKCFKDQELKELTKEVNERIASIDANVATIKHVLKLQERMKTRKITFDEAVDISLRAHKEIYEELAKR